MIAVFLYFNALLYAVFAAWCTFAPRRTAEAMGYSSVSASGQSEYLVVYGGLQLGLGLFFLYCARTGEDRLVAILAGRQHHAGDRRPGAGAAAGQHRFVVGRTGRA